MKTGSDGPSAADIASVVKSRPSSTKKIRRLIADHRYFGLEALAFHEGAGRVFARVVRSRGQGHLDMKTLAEDFRLDELATRTLVRALLAGALLHPDGNGGYRPTERFREYANACVVSPMSRGRAKLLLEAARDTAERINADWSRNPYVVWTLAVSGAYMTRRRRLHEVSLWLVLRRRPQSRRARWRTTLSKDDALLQIAAAMKALSSFVVVHVASDRERIARPFAIVFEMIEQSEEPHLASWQRVRQWTASISRRFGGKRNPKRHPPTTRLR